MGDAARQPFQYATVQVVPRVDRGERINCGVIVFCRPLDYLRARTSFEQDLLFMLDRTLDLDVVRDHLHAVERIARGDADAGPIAALSTSERFHWLVAPSSTIIQPSPSHTGMCSDPAVVLDRLFDDLVSRVSPGA